MARGRTEDAGRPEVVGDEPAGGGDDDDVVNHRAVTGVDRVQDSGRPKSVIRRAAKNSTPGRSPV
jgi:hypothetical protein